MRGKKKLDPGKEAHRERTRQFREEHQSAGGDRGDGVSRRNSTRVVMWWLQLSAAATRDRDKRDERTSAARRGRRESPPPHTGGSDFARHRHRCACRTSVSAYRSLGRRTAPYREPASLGPRSRKWLR